MDWVGVATIVAVLVVGSAAGLWRRRTDGRMRDVAPLHRRPQPTSPRIAGRAVAKAADSGAAAAIPGGAGPGGASLSGAGSGAAGSSAAVSDGACPGGACPRCAGSGAAGSGAAVLGGAASGGAGSGAAGSSATVSDGAGSGGGVSDVGAGLRVVPDRVVEPGLIEGSGRDRGAAGESLTAALLAELGVGPAEATLLQFSSAFCAPCRAVRRVSSEVADMLPGVQHVEVDAESHLDAVRALGIWRTPTLLVLDADGRVVKRATGVPAKAQLIAVLGEVLPGRH